MLYAMFKPSQPATEPDLFTQTDHLLSGQAASQYSDPNAWHNQFHKHIKTRIDESIYNVLFDQRGGAPNAPVSVLVSMMILKEFFGWSDQQLFEHCRFHILVRKALGMTNMHDPLPVESTYYLLRKRMYEYNRSHGQDLMEQTFRSITAEQMRTFEVHGRQLRMDSKLFGSNIAWYSRYELIHRTLLGFCKDLDQGELSGFTREQRGQLTAFSQEQPAKVVYNESKTQLTNRLHQMGVLIYKLLHSCGDRRDQDDWKLLKRVFDEQYEVLAQPEETIELRSKEHIASNSVQSPDDPDCAYRKKAGQQVKGYVANLTETIGDQQLNLICDVRVEQAHTSDSAMLSPSLQASQAITGDAPETVYLDGGYQSPDHDQSWPQTDFVYTGIQGAESRYQHSLQGEDLYVSDTQTGQTYQGRPVKKHKQTSGKRWSIKTNEGKRVYFDEKAVRAGIVRKQIKERLPEQRHVRNNVEATLYHLFCKMSGGKSRYRGLARQVTMVLCRAIGVNLHRIMKYEATGDSESLVVAGNNLYFRLYHWPKTVLLKIIAQTRSIIGLLQTQSLKLEIE